MSFDSHADVKIPAGYFCIKNVKNSRDDNWAINFQQVIVNRTKTNGDDEYIALEKVEHHYTTGKTKRYWWEKNSIGDKQIRADELSYGGRLLISGNFDVEYSIGVVNVFKRKASKAGDFKIASRITTETENQQVLLGYSPYFLSVGLPLAIIFVGFCLVAAF